MAGESKKTPVVDPNALKPKSNLLMIGSVLVLIGAAYGIYAAFIRPENEDEKKERIEREKDEAAAKRQQHH